MRKFSIFLSTFVLLALLLTACGGEATNTSIPSTNVPPITAEVTSTSEGTTATETLGTGDLTTTPGVPGPEKTIQPVYPTCLISPSGIRMVSRWARWMTWFWM